MDAESHQKDFAHQLPSFHSKFLGLLMISLPISINIQSLTLIYAQSLHEFEYSPHCNVEGDAWKFDCIPQGPVLKSECLARGCCWHPFREIPEIPICYFPSNFTTYTVTSVEEHALGSQIIASLRRVSPYGEDIKSLTAEFMPISDTLLHIHMKDSDKERWEPPPLEALKKSSYPHKDEYSFPKLTLKWASLGHPFGFTIFDDTGNTLLQTTGAFIFANQFLQLSFLLPSLDMYGLGQHRGKLQLDMNWQTYTIWNHDNHHVVEGANLYGSHPFYISKAGQVWYGFFLHNTNAMDVVLQPAPAITWRPIGGIFDMYVFIGPNPSTVIAQYQSIIGRPFLPPYWSLGFHLCAQEYGSALETYDVVRRMRKMHIPQDVQWNDIEYAYKNRVFTNDVKQFGNQKQLVKDLHDLGVHYVMMADCGISNTAPSGSYPPYDLGQKLGLFIKDLHGQNLVGRVWPGDTVWPDFLHSESQAYWQQLISQYHQNVSFDGLWLDMNEISNFVDGSIHGCPYNSSLDFPPYVPGKNGSRLFAHTLCSSAVHQMSSHYNIHNLYSLYEAKRSYFALWEIRRERPFLISRSSSPGLGVFSGTWSGDNKAGWYDMYKSISAMLHMNMYGIPLTGSDICGFYLNATEELCTRWHQLGAFYSFARNHHSQGTKAQDPTAFSDSSINSTRKALTTRYRLLPYLYTLLWFAHSHGHTVIRPLFLEFPEDKSTYNLDSQFLWGSALLISPVLKEKERHVWAYFPKAIWYDFYNGRKMNTTGHYVKLSAPLDVIPLHIRAGSVIITQEPAQTTRQSRKLPFALIAALDSSGVAQGYHYLDDGITAVEDSQHSFSLLKYLVEKNSLHSEWMDIGYTAEPVLLDHVTVYGLTFHPRQVTLNLKPIPFFFINKVLRIPDLQIHLLHQQFIIEWHV